MTHLTFTILSTLMQFRTRRGAGRGDRGQTTAEYALVLLGAAAIAMLVLAWAAQTNQISSLLDAVLNSVTGLVT